MKQLYIFDMNARDSESLGPSPLSAKRVHWTLCIDGASRGNPGTSGVGISILRNNQMVESHGFYVGKKTNNQAEYLALLLGLFFVQKLMGAGDTIVIKSDSQLLVRQVQGTYKVKHVELKPLHGAALAILKGISYEVTHVMREHNTQADDLANQGIDKKAMVSDAIVAWLRAHGVSL
jgi:ribonuclease HI